MNKKLAALALLASTSLAPAFAAEGPVPTGIPHLDHVFLIMMENHGYQQIIGNPSAPFINAEAAAANLATNYFAVAHPSLTNYLEVVGGSNFGVLDDNSPDWHNTTCQPNLATGLTNTEAVATPICPIAGSGTDASTPAIDYSNETSGPPGVINVDGTVSFDEATNVSGKTIGDQLSATGRNWKSYQENLPLGGPDLIDNSDGVFTNLTDFSIYDPSLGYTGALVNLYASKHNPFVYFANVQANLLTPAQFAGFDGAGGFYADLAASAVPAFSFIAPNQCNDMHGRGNAGAFCNYDPMSTGTQTGLNPALIIRGDVTVQKLVTSIKASPVWAHGRNAIVIVWDENDYSISPITNQVVTIVDTNYGSHGRSSKRFYTHFSLLRSMEAGFGLPCLNHACDGNAGTMGDLFSH